MTSPSRSRACATAAARSGVVGFNEFVNSSFRGLPGLRIMDLEHDVGAFTAPLPRVRVIPIDEFDPLDFL